MYLSTWYCYWCILGSQAYFLFLALYYMIKHICSLHIFHERLERCFVIHHFHAGGSWCTPTSNVPSSSWVPNWWHFLMPAHPWGTEGDASSLLLCWPNGEDPKDLEEGETMRRKEPGSLNGCMELYCNLHGIETGMRINLLQKATGILLLLSS